MKRENSDLGPFYGWEKPCWSEWFMAQAFLIATRSIDPNTKHGCIVVDQNNRPLTYGYNGPPRGCDDSSIPLSRPEKYHYMAHAEENAINNAANKGISLNDSIFYVTGYPCNPCLRSIINVGASKVIYEKVDSQCVDDDSIKASEIMLKNRNFCLVPFEGEVVKTLQMAIDYYNIKVLGKY